MATLVYDARNPFRKKTLLILEALHLLLEAFIGIDLRLRGISVVRGLWPNCAMPFGGLVHCRPRKSGTWSPNSVPVNVVPQRILCRES
jgi:hypothetical protein